MARGLRHELLEELRAGPARRGAGRSGLPVAIWRRSRTRLFAEHLAAEYRVKTVGRGRTVDEWKIRPEQVDNQWLDGVVGCAAAASIQGAVLFGTGEPQKQRQTVRSQSGILRPSPLGDVSVDSSEGEHGPGGLAIVALVGDDSSRTIQRASPFPADLRKLQEDERQEVPQFVDVGGGKDIRQRDSIPRRH